MWEWKHVAEPEIVVLASAELAKRAAKFLINAKDYISDFFHRKTIHNWLHFPGNLIILRNLLLISTKITSQWMKRNNAILTEQELKTGTVHKKRTIRKKRNKKGEGTVTNSPSFENEVVIISSRLRLWARLPFYGIILPFKADFRSFTYANTSYLDIIPYFFSFSFPDLFTFLWRFFSDIISGWWGLALLKFGKEKKGKHEWQLEYLQK